MINPTPTKQKLQQGDRKILPSYRSFIQKTAGIDESAGKQQFSRKHALIPMFMLALVLALALFAPIRSTSASPGSAVNSLVSNAIPNFTPQPTSPELYSDCVKGQCEGTTGKFENPESLNCVIVHTSPSSVCSTRSITKLSHLLLAETLGVLKDLNQAVSISSTTTVSSGTPRLKPQQQDSPTDWLTGKDFDSKLSNIQSVVWERVPLAQVVRQSQENHRIRIWVDRRVDTSQIVDLKLANLTVAQSISKLAEQCNAEAVFMSPLMIIVPQGTGSQLLALRADLQHQLQQLPGTIERKLLHTESTEWTTVKQPNDLLRQWISPIAESLEHLDSLPHDLWAPANLPALSLADRLLLLSFGFERQFDLTQRNRQLSLKLQKISADRKTTCLISDASWISKLKSTQNQWSAQHPKVDLKSRRSENTLEGPLGEIAAVLRIALQEPKSNDAPRDLSRQRFTLTVSQQLAGNVLQTIAQQTNLTLDYDEEAKSALQKRIDLKAEELTLQLLLKEVAEASATRIEIQGERIIIRVP